MMLHIQIKILSIKMMQKIYEMVAKFVERAKAAEPEGVVVLNRSGASDITLEHSDTIVIPSKSDVVLVSKEVMVPQAML